LHANPTNADIKKYLGDLGVDLPTSWASAAEKATYLLAISVEDTLAMEQAKQITMAEQLLRPKKQVKIESFSRSRRSTTAPPKKARKKTKTLSTPPPEPHVESEGEDDGNVKGVSKGDDNNDENDENDQDNGKPLYQFFSCQHLTRVADEERDGNTGEYCNFLYLFLSFSSFLGTPSRRHWD